jgi:hypothetical protein
VSSTGRQGKNLFLLPFEGGLRRKTKQTVNRRRKSKTRFSLIN